MAEGERRRRRLRRGPQPAPDAAAETGPGPETRPDPETRREPEDRPRPEDRRGPEGRPVPARPREPHAETPAVHDPEPEFGIVAPAARAAPSAEDREVERGLRGLVGSGTSQVGIGAALRARDAARPSDEDLAAADEHLVIVRRNWVPRDDLPRPPR